LRVSSRGQTDCRLARLLPCPAPRTGENAGADSHPTSLRFPSGLAQLQSRRADRQSEPPIRGRSKHLPLGFVGILSMKREHIASLLPRWRLQSKGGVFVINSDKDDRCVTSRVESRPCAHLDSHGGRSLDADRPLWRHGDKGLPRRRSYGSGDAIPNSRFARSKPGASNQPRFRRQSETAAAYSEKGEIRERP
jgi:hypothetical protein